MTRLLKNQFSFPIGFGGAAISGEGGGYGFGNISESDAISLLNQAYELGFRFFDSAPIYGFGLSEIRIGKAFKDKREKVFLTSKSGVTWHENRRVDMTNDPKTTQKMLEQSLRDLNTDYIDLFMIHWPDAKVDIRKPLEVLARAKHAGKIKHIGLCNTSISDLELASEIEKIEVVQSQMNLFETSVAEQLFDYLRENQISFQSWGTLDKGILTGSVDKKREQQKKYDESDCRKNAPWWNQAEVVLKAQRVEKLHHKLKQENVNPLSFCLAHNLHYPEVDMVLVGARNSHQLTTLIEAYKNLPTAEQVAEIMKEI